VKMASGRGTEKAAIRDEPRPSEFHGRSGVWRLGRWIATCKES
jgi:hypothetical protein